MTKNSSNFSNQQSLQSLQSEACNAIRENIAANNIVAIDNEGMAQSLEIEDGKPRPENIIRVTLYFQALDHKINANGPIIKPVKRGGFTVVEWGGTEIESGMKRHAK